MILLTLGTDKLGFPRAVDAMLACPSLAGERIVIQAGHTDEPATLPDHVEWHKFIAYGDLLTAIREADVVVCHAGIGSIMMALEASRRPVIVARLARFNEHVDDHQLDIADRMAEEGLVTYARDLGDLDEKIAEARGAADSAEIVAGAELATAVMAAIGYP